MPPSQHSHRTSLAAGWLVIAAVALLWAEPVRADELWPEAEPSEYQRAMARADELVQRADELHDHANYVRDMPLARRLTRDSVHFLEQAVAEYERAARLNSGEAEPRCRAADALEWFFADSVKLPRVDRRSTERAIAHLTACIDLAPLDPRVDDRLFRRSILLTKLGGERNFRKAIADYDRELTITGTRSPRNMAMLLSNYAELLMALGELERAIDYYTRALEYERDTLYAAGLAVALDRDGQTTRSREVLRGHTPAAIVAALTKDSVFFVPTGEIYYYQALAFEVAGDLAKAAESYRAFILALPTSRYAPRARDNIRNMRKRADGRRDEGRRTRPGRDADRDQDKGDMIFDAIPF